MNTSGEGTKSHKEVMQMLFIVRGKNRMLRVEADSPEEAEKIGWKRGLFVTEVVVADASKEAGALDRVAGIVWTAWKRTSPVSLKAFGRRISSGQSAALLALGMITWAVDLHALKFL